MTAGSAARVRRQPMALRTVAVLACVVAACLFVVSRADAAAVDCLSPLGTSAVVPPSTFEGGDGNLCVDISGHTDWTSLSPATLALINDGALPSPPAAAQPDSQFGTGNGAKQLRPGNWQWINAGEVSPPKSNLLNAVITHENVPNPTVLDPGAEDVFLYAAFHVQGDSGNTNADIELNQIPFDEPGGSITTTAGSVVPARQPGDLLITYDGSFGSISVGLCKWVGPPEGQTVDPDAGWYGVDANGDVDPTKQVDSNTDCTKLDSTKAIAATNSADLPNAGVLPNFPNPIPSETFGELSLNLSKTLVPSALSNAGNPCFSFGSFWMHTRSSSTVSADGKDLMTPMEIPAIGSCSVGVDKKVKVHGSANPFADSTTASVGDTLDYEISVENTGTTSLDTPLDIDEMNECANLSASPVRTEHKSGTPPTLGADSSPTTFDAGDVWTYTCNFNSTGQTPGGSYTNHVSVTGHRGNYDTPAATDSATATFRSEPTPNTTASANAAIGATLTDTLNSFSGASGTPTGTVTFKLYKVNTATVNAACTTGATLVHTSSPISINGGLPVSDSYTPTPANGAGTYQWVVEYAGDANNDPGKGSCTEPTERTVLSKVTPAPVTSATITGSNPPSKAGVAGDGSTDQLTGFTGASGTPTGTATFRLYKIDPNAPVCNGGTLVYTGSAKTLVSGTASDSYTPTLANGAGTYQWVVSYDGSADPNNNSSAGTCTDATERFTTGKAHPTIATTPAPGSAKLGTPLKDDGVFQDAHNPTGTVTYQLYKIAAGAPVCDGTTLVFTSAGRPIDANGNSSSGTFTPTATGTYQWVVSYAGDNDNDPFTGSCTDTSERVTVDDPQLAITKAADKATAHEGDTVTYTITVTNPGVAALHDVEITDPKCSAAPTLVSKKTGNTDDASTATLDPGDTWTYTCSATMPAGNSFTNTATVNAKDPRNDPVPPKDGSATTTIVHPAIAVAKTGPATATAGDTVQFTLTVTNPGDVALTSVTVTDDKCPSAPALQSKTRGGAADPSPGTLDPGDTWTYTCSIATSGGQTSLTNTARAQGTDPIGKVVASTGAHTVTINPAPAPPQQAVLAENVKSGVADFVKAPKKCVTKTFRLDVKGTQIQKITFKVDGKKIKALAKPDAQGRWSIKINPLLRNDKRHTVTAEVQYTAASKTAPKTLKVFFKRCACISRRAFTIRLRKQFHQGLKTASVFINGKRVRVIRGAKRLKAPIRLVGLPKGRVTVKINAVTIGGKRVTGTRRYLTCNKKLKGGIPKL